MKPDFSQLQCILQYLLTKKNIRSSFDVFESNEKFAPTHWGSCETIQVEYKPSGNSEK